MTPPPFLSAGYPTGQSDVSLKACGLTLSVQNVRLTDSREPAFFFVGRPTSSLLIGEDENIE